VDPRTRSLDPVWTQLVPDWVPPNDTGYRLGPTHDSCWFQASRITDTQVSCDDGQSELYVFAITSVSLLALTV